MCDLWKITSQTFANDAQSIMRNGTVYQLANGHMGYRGTLDEFGPDEMVGVTLAGLFDRVGDAWREPVNAPNGAFTQIVLDGVPVSARVTEIRSHRQTLDLRRAVFSRQTAYVSHGKTLQVESVRFLSAADPHLGVVRFQLRCDAAAQIEICTGIDGTIWDLNGPHLPHLKHASQDGILLVHGKTHEAARTVAVAEAADIPFGHVEQQVRNNRNLHIVTLNVEAGKTYSFEKFFAVHVDATPADEGAIATAVATAVSAQARGFDACLQEHTALWQKKWDMCDVVIEGDDEAQRALRYSIFQLLIAAPVSGSNNSIPARALSGQVYKGAIFWDTEMFMLPFFLHTDPAKALELLRYRIKTLDGARRKAKTEGAGYRGAFYAWESQETGDDACTYFNIGDPLTKRDLRTHFRDKQIHISGDIAIAIWTYVKTTGDTSLLLDGGAEVILECARFYYSYAYFKKEKNRYELIDVTGPDEYHERVNNNAFTNMVAKVTFEIAGAVAQYLKGHHANAFQNLVDRIAIADELPLFAEAARLLYVPQPDAETGVIEQFDGYFDLKDTSVEALKAQKIHPDEYLGAGQGLAVPTKIIKQADVVMMLNLFKDRYSQAVKQANWEYYEPRTEHGSSLSACAYAMVAAAIGKLDFSYRYFLKTAKVDLDAKYKIYVGTVFIGGSHPAANGGAWMTAIFGFGGVSTNEKEVTISPRLYERWTSLRFNIVYKGDRFAIAITHRGVDVVAADENAAARNFVICGKAYACAPGERISASVA